MGKREGGKMSKVRSMVGEIMRRMEGEGMYLRLGGGLGKKGMGWGLKRHVGLQKKA